MASAMEAVEVGNRGSEPVVYKGPPRGCSTAQMRLLRIIQVISSGYKEKAPGESPKPATNRVCGNGDSGGSRAAARDFLAGFGIDLNLRLGPSGEVLAWEDPPAAKAAVAATATAAEGEGVSSVCSGVGGNDGAKAASGVGLCSSVESGDVSTVEKVGSNEECHPEGAVAKISEIPAAEGDNGVGEENEAEARELSGITNVVGKITARRRNGEACRDRGEEEARSGQGRDSRCDGISHKDDDDEAVPEAGDEGGNEKRKDGEGGYLHLLLDAVRHISGEFDDEAAPPPVPPPPSPPPLPEKATEPVREPEPERSRSSRPARKREWWLDFYGAFEEETAPIVRSKRGRNQVIPSRYRDSVLDPWRPLPRPRR